MPKPVPSRQTILNHDSPAEAGTGATWSAPDGPVRIGRVSRVTQAELRLPSTAVAAHFSLMLLLEGQGHFHMRNATEGPLAQAGARGSGSRDGWLEFLAGHCYLTCSFQPFDCEDYVPANISFRAIFLHFPLALRAVAGPGVPVAHTGSQVLAHRHGAAWIARLAMPAQAQAFAQSLMEHGLPLDPLELLQVQYRSLAILHATVSALLLREPAPACALAPSTGPGGHAPAEPSAAPAAQPGRIRPAHLSSRDRRQLLQARRFIDEHLPEPLSLAQVAAASGLSESTLKTGFRLHFGASVYDHVLQKRCQLACSLLRETELSVLEVAMRSGFSSASLLARHFRRLVGKTPLQVRKSQALPLE